MSFVVEHLQQWNVSDQPFSHLTETSKDGTVGWLVHTFDSRQNISRFRLACRGFYNSSHRCFGAVLGDRVFQPTKDDLKDLEAMSNNHSFGTPHPNTDFWTCRIW